MSNPKENKENNDTIEHSENELDAAVGGKLKIVEGLPITVESRKPKEKIYPLMPKEDT